MINPPRRLYWDSCTWLGLINEEPDKHPMIAPFWLGARRGEYEIYTSTAVYLEVFKVSAEKGEALTIEESDKRIDEMLDAPYVKRVQLDVEIAKLARQLRRSHAPPLKKRWDAIHLATALTHNVDALHTYDGSDLLPLDGKITRRDGKLLRICLPDPDSDAPLLKAMRPP